MDDLEIIANKFKEWRGNRRYYRYPKHFWDDIQRLAKLYPLSVIADSFGINLQYLRQKISDSSDSLTFIPLTLSSIPQSQVSIEFFDRNSHPMTIRFHADPGQLTHMILSLAGHTQ